MQGVVAQSTAGQRHQLTQPIPVQTAERDVHRTTEVIQLPLILFELRDDLQGAVMSVMLGASVKNETGESTRSVARTR